MASGRQSYLSNPKAETVGDKTPEGEIHRRARARIPPTQRHPNNIIQYMSYKIARCCLRFGMEFRFPFKSKSRGPGIVQPSCRFYGTSGIGFQAPPPPVPIRHPKPRLAGLGVHFNDHRLLCDDFVSLVLRLTPRHREDGAQNTNRFHVVRYIIRSDHPATGIATVANLPEKGRSPVLSNFTDKTYRLTFRTFGLALNPNGGQSPKLDFVTGRKK